MSAVIDWRSSDIPYYLDKEAVADTTFYLWDEYAPRKSGNMASHSDYEVQGRGMYVWNTCEYSAYQNYETRLAGWFTDELSKTFDRVVEDFDRYAKEEAPLPSWMEKIINEAVGDD